jgi:arylsulfatase A-like enzyme
MTDWLPSLLEIIGENFSDTPNWDGESIWKYLKNPDDYIDPNRSFYWKIKGASAVRKGDWKLLIRDDGHTELYDLKVDFRENRDLSDQHPEQVRSMLALLEEYRRDDRE